MTAAPSASTSPGAAGSNTPGRSTKQPKTTKKSKPTSDPGTTGKMGHHEHRSTSTWDSTHDPASDPRRDPDCKEPELPHGSSMADEVRLFGVKFGTCRPTSFD